MYGTGPDPGVRFRYHRLVCGDWWDEDPVSPTYNTFRHVACGTTPAFGAGSEALWRATDVYSTLAVVRYNADPVVRGAGSAIFLHADNGLATTGCVSLPRRRPARAAPPAAAVRAAARRDRDTVADRFARTSARIEA